MVEVGCAGLLVEDKFCGPMATLPPEGQLLALEDMPVRAGGCAANVAIDLARQGIRTDVIGCVGQDSAAQVLFQTFTRYGIGASQIVQVERLPTSQTVILLIDGQDRRYLHVSGANRALGVDHIPRSWIASLKIFYLGGLFALPGIDIDALGGLLEFCRNQNVTTVVDVVVPQGQNGMASIGSLLPLIDVFVPNDDEARAFTGLTDHADQLEVFERAGARTVIITCGGRGSVASHKGKRWSCGTYQMDVVDPSGSGDAFTSGVIRSLLAGWDMPQTLRYASAIGASATRAAGTTDAVFSAAEADRFLNEHPLTVRESP